MPSKHDRKESTERVPRYGDFPELFWDLRPDASVDVTHPSILARILREGRLDVILSLVPLSLLRKELPNLFVPDYTRRFWTRVLEIVDQPVAAPSTHRARA